MYFSNPWGLLALGIVPAIAVIHLYQRRFPPLVLAGLHLWTSEIRPPQSGRRRERLPLSRSLWLELVAALILSLILSGPHVAGFEQQVHVVVMLDDSASMSARSTAEPSFRDLAVKSLKDRAARLPRRTVWSLIRSGIRPELIAGPKVHWSDIEQALATWQPRSTSHQLSTAWELGLQLAEESGELLFLTDHMPPEQELPPRMEVVAFGQRLKNCAITTSRYLFDANSGQGQIYARVRHFGASSKGQPESAARGEAVLRHKNIVLARQALEIPQGRTAELTWQVPGGLQAVRVELQIADDALALDNVAYLVEPHPALLHVSNLLPTGPASQQIDRALRTVSGVSLEKSSTPHLLIGPAAERPTALRDAWWLGIGPLATTDAARQSAIDVLGPYLLDKRDALLNDVTLGGVIWGGVQPLETPLKPLVSVGDHVLLGLLPASSQRAYVLNIDLARSNLANSPDLPIMLSNLIELRRAELPGLPRWNYKIGETVSFRLFEEDTDPAPEKPLELASSTATKSLHRSREMDVLNLSEPGIYVIRQGEEVWDRFGLSFVDQQESDLQKMGSGRLPPRDANREEAEARGIDPWIFRLGLLAMAIVLLLDWHVLKAPNAKTVPV